MSETEGGSQGFKVKPLGEYKPGEINLGNSTQAEVSQEQPKSVEERAREMQMKLDQQFNSSRLATEVSPVQAPNKMPLGRQEGPKSDSGASSRLSATAGTSAGRRY